MNKWLFILLFSFSIGLFSAQSSDAKKRMLNMVEKLERVPPYSCDVNINIDVKFIRIKERLGKFIYGSRDQIDYILIGFGFLRKKEMG